MKTNESTLRDNLKTVLGSMALLVCFSVSIAYAAEENTFEAKGFVDADEIVFPGDGDCIYPETYLAERVADHVADQICADLIFIGEAKRISSYQYSKSCMAGGRGFARFYRGRTGARANYQCNTEKGEVINVIR